jgi:hypothetical protein
MIKAQVIEKVFLPVLILWALAGCLVALTSVTNNTGNIFAWGFDGLPMLTTRKITMFIYEATHMTAAFAALMLGLWAICGCAVFEFWCGRRDRQWMTHTLYIGCGAAAATGLVCNLAIMRLTNLTVYPEMMLIPYGFIPEYTAGEASPTGRLILFVFPLILALVFAAVSKIFREASLSRMAVTLSLLCIVAGYCMMNYDMHHYLCGGGPNAFVAFLRSASPVIAVVPVVVYCITTLRLPTIPRNDGADVQSSG